MLVTSSCPRITDKAVQYLKEGLEHVASLQNPAPAREERPGAPLESTMGSSNAVYAVTVPTCSTELEWYSPERVTYSTLEDAKAAGIWSYPSTLYERAKCAVFQDLWEKGHFMGGGIKFGGDFLVYPGKTDPFKRSF